MYKSKRLAPQLSHCTIRVQVEEYTSQISIHESKDPQIWIESNLYVECVENCDGKVLNSRSLCLRVKTATGNYSNIDFEWKIGEGDNATESTESIEIKSISSRILIIKENTLKPGVKYTIKVFVKTTNNSVKYSFETDELRYEGNCTISPESGIKGNTYFDIICKDYKNKPDSLVFEFYDKYSVIETNIFSDRMLGSSTSGYISRVTLTRGNVFIYIFNKVSGAYTSRIIGVKLTDSTTSSVNDTLMQLSTLVSAGNLLETLGFISSIPDTIHPEVDKRCIFANLLKIVVHLELATIDDVKLSASTLTNVLLTLNKNKTLNLSPNLMMNTFDNIQRQANILKEQAIDREQRLRWMSPHEFRLVSTALLDCLTSVLTSKDKGLVGLKNDEFKINDLYELRQGSITAEQAMDLVGKIITDVQETGYPPRRISADKDSFVVWAMKNDPEFDISDLLQNNPDIPIDLSKSKLFQSPNSRIEARITSARIATMKENIFWWSDSVVNSNLISVSLTTNKTSKTTVLDFPVVIKMNIINGSKVSKISDSTVQLDPNLNIVDLDSAIKIHRLDPAPKSLIHIQFIFPPTNSSVRVLIKRNIRPDYNTLLNGSHILTKESPVYPVNIYGLEIPSFLFMAVLPGPEVSINQSVIYSFEVSTSLCQIWSRGRWTTTGCKANPNSIGSEVFCQCTHLSIFGAASLVPPEKIDPFSDVTLFLTVLDNPYVVIFVSILLLTYLIVCIWASYKDRSDKRLNSVVVLEDNIPSDKYPYLVAVYTSPRLNSGTTAHVGIRLYGQSNDSRPHILCSKDRKVLKKSYDDWFLIFCPKRLGDVESVHLWHDNSGPSPEWFCGKIYVYDLLEKTETLFIVDQWLALTLTDYPEAVVQTASISDIKSVKRIFLNNVFSGFRENHDLFSIVMMHPRSIVSRLIRISVFMCCIMVGMLCSIMFYKPNDGSFQMDDYKYQIGPKELVVSIQSLIICVVITFLVMLPFKKSYKITYSKELHMKLRWREDKFDSTHVNIHSVDETESKELSSEQDEKSKSVGKRLFGFVSKKLKGDVISPVGLESSIKTVKVLKFRLVLAWVFCTTVILVCGYLVMLYGLKMGRVQSQKWLTSVFFTLGESVLVTGPIKIFFLALILSLLFQTSININVHHVSLSDVTIVKPSSDDEHVDNVIKKRNDPMYFPLPLSSRKKLLAKRKQEYNWTNLIQFLVSVCFTVVLACVISKLWSSHYYANNEISKLIVNSRRLYYVPINFFDVKNISDMELFLKFSFVNEFYVMRWYNCEFLNENNIDKKRYWSGDFIHRMVGLPLLRQFRVTLTNCTDLNKNKVKCIPHFSDEYEDTHDYGEGWTPASPFDLQKTNFPWRYTKGSDSDATLSLNLFNLYGESNQLLHEGGYSTELGPTKKDVELTLAELREKSWQDERTRVVILQFTLYNVNQNLISETTIVVEYLVSGYIHHKLQTLTVENDIKVWIWEILFLCFIIYYIVTNISLINRFGFLEHMSVISNTCSMAIVLLGMLAIHLLCIHFYVSSTYKANFQDNGENSNFDFGIYSMYFSNLKVVLSALMCIAILRVILLIRGGRTILNQYNTFKMSIRSICWISVVLVIVVVAKYEILTCMFLFPLFKSKELVITYGTMKNTEPHNILQLHVQLFVVIKTVFLCLCTTLLIVVFLDNAKLTRLHKSDTVDTLNFFTFVVSEIKRKING